MIHIKQQPCQVENQGNFVSNSLVILQVGPVVEKQGADATEDVHGGKISKML